MERINVRSFHQTLQTLILPFRFSDFSAVTSEGLLPLTCRNVPLRAGIALLPPGVQTVSTHQFFPHQSTSGLSCALPPRCLIGWLCTDCSTRQPATHRIKCSIESLVTNQSDSWKTIFQSLLFLSGANTNQHKSTHILSQIYHNAIRHLPSESQFQSPPPSK